ncbi:MAG: energy-coupling factor transporter transmembrane protein EcfT [Tissierellia bacterium]|jgi:energy-coupling factor transport system permease protein|nr:energy-coupling factor transporter transmembrane component T [Bacillota bacterium]NLK58912.1 energy-coupling factor transporter transmembrane protein EcfT [Tissierellia bacterium]
MLKNITIGQYYPGDSIVHELDPRIKILVVTLFIVSIFFVNTFIGYLPLLVFILTVIAVSGIPALAVLRGLKPLLFIIAITVFFNMIMTPGEVVYRLGFINITKEGLRQAGFMALRLIFLVTGTSLLTLTTSPIALTDGIESVLNPFRRIGVPAHELAMMMTIALRFIPTLMEETEKIMKAQMARGADFESGNILRRAKNLVPLLVPLFVNAFRRADELATAMEARCYRGGEGRTRLKPLIYRRTDYIVAGLCVVFFGFVIAQRFLFA